MEKENEIDKPVADSVTDSQLRAILVQQAQELAYLYQISALLMRLCKKKKLFDDKDVEVELDLISSELSLRNVMPSGNA